MRSTLRGRGSAASKTPAGAEHDGGRAQDLDLDRQLRGEPVTHGRDDHGREAAEVQRNLVLEFAHIAVDDAGADRGVDLGVCFERMGPVPAGERIGRRLTEGVAEQAEAAKTVVGQLSADADRIDRTVITRVFLGPVVGVR